MSTTPYQQHETEFITFTKKPTELGVAYAGLEGTLNGDVHRILLRIVIPQNRCVSACFSTKPNGAF